MAKQYICTILFMIFLITGCTSIIKNETVLGTWVNTEEKCEIQLNKNNTFKSKGLPLDIENKHYLVSNSQTGLWEGTWSIENNQIKLIDSYGYYYLDIDNINKTHLYVKLLEESGGKTIYFNKQ